MAKSGSIGFDPTSAVSQGLNVIVGTIAQVSDAKKNREMQEKLAKLSLKQQQQLETRLQDARNQIDRLNIMYRTFAVMENDKLVNETTNRRLTLFYFLGGGALLLVGMAIVFKNRK